MGGVVYLSDFLNTSTSFIQSIFINIYYHLLKLRIEMWTSQTQPLPSQTLGPSRRHRIVNKILQYGKVTAWKWSTRCYGDTQETQPTQTREDIKHLREATYKIKPKRWSRIGQTGMAGVFVCSAEYRRWGDFNNKHFSRFWRLFLGEDSLPGYVFTWPSLVLHAEKERSHVSPSFYKCINASLRNPLSWPHLTLLTSQKPISKYHHFGG